MGDALATFRATHQGHVLAGPVPVTFFVPGRPRGQGNHRTSASGYIYETTKGHTAWRKTVADYARLEVRATGRVFHGPCALTLAFVIAPPKRQTRPYPTRLMDSDTTKLARCAEDGLVAGGLILDDKLVVELHATKRWGTTPGVTVTVTVNEVTT